MKIAFIANTSWNIHNFRIGVVRQLIAQGHQVFVATPKDAFTDKLIAEGCEWIQVKLQNKGTNPLADLFYLLQLCLFFLKYKPDVACQYTIKSNIYGSFAAALCKVRTINNVSGLGTVFLHDNLTAKIAKILYRWAFKYPEKVFFQNADDQKLFLNEKLVSKEVCDLLPGSGVDLSYFQFKELTPINPFKFLMVARLLYDKGVMEYFEAAKALRSVGVEFHLVGAPDFDTNLGISRKELESLISEGIVYHSFNEDIRKLYQQAHCIVLPSYREGTAKSLLEALAVGRAIVTTDVPGCRETIVDGQNGYLCKVRDVPSLVDKMQQMLACTYNQCANMGKTSRQIAEQRYDQAFVIEAYLNAIFNKIPHASM